MAEMELIEQMREKEHLKTHCHLHLMKLALHSEGNSWRNKSSENGTKEKRTLRDYRMKD